MSAQVTETAHGSLGLGVDDLLAMHRTMLTARLIDEAALRQNRMGRAPFVVPVSGHEGCQIGTAWPMRPGIDIWVPYYRDLGVVLVAGMTPEQIFLGLFSKASDPTSGGRQMPSHWSSRGLGIVSHSSPISTQVPHAAGIAYAMNNHDQAVGWVPAADGSTVVASIWQKDRATGLITITTLPILPGDGAAFATGINNRGQVAGVSFSVRGPEHAFLWDRGRLTALDPQGAATAYAVNDKGQVAGEAGVNLNGSQAWAEAMCAVATNPEWRHQRRTKSLERAREFSWTRTAQLTYEVYEEALKRF